MKLINDRGARDARQFNAFTGLDAHLAHQSLLGGRRRLRVRAGVAPPLKHAPPRRIRFAGERQGERTHIGTLGESLIRHLKVNAVRKLRGSQRRGLYLDGLRVGNRKVRVVTSTHGARERPHKRIVAAGEKLLALHVHGGCFAAVDVNAHMAAGLCRIEAPDHAGAFQLRDGVDVALAPRTDDRVVITAGAVETRHHVCRQEVHA